MKLLQKEKVWSILILFLLWGSVVSLPPAAVAKGEGNPAEKVEAKGEPVQEKEGAKEEKKGSQEEAKGEECPATFGPIITDTAIPIEKGKFAVQPTFGLSFVTHSLTQSWRRVSAGGNYQSFSMDYKFTYGLWNNLEVFVVVPYVQNWAGSVNEPGPNGERSASFGGLGDINLTFKYRLVEETETRPTVTALFATDFPSGHVKRLNPGRLGTDAIGGGAYVFTTGLNLSKYVKPFIFYGNLWYSMQTASSRLGEDEEGYSLYFRNYPRDFVTVNLAAEYPITKKWVALLEFTSYWDGGRLFGHRSNVAPAALLSMMPGIEYMATEKFSLALGVNFDLAGKNTNANITPLLSLVYTF
jgi:hypothetical protein